MDELVDTNVTRGNGYPTTPELIDAVRRCAADKMSARQAADQLWTKEHPLTRNSIIGIAHRNGISFKGRQSNVRHVSHKKKPGPRRSKRQYERVPAQDAMQPNVMTAIARRLTLPGPLCSWVGCTNCAELHDMFCFSHGKKGLMT